MKLEKNISRVKNLMGLNELELQESWVKSKLSPQERYEEVAKVIIDFMDKKGITEIPSYSFLETYPDSVKEFGFNIKGFMYRFLNQGEYHKFVKPLIKSFRPDFTFPTPTGLGQPKHEVDKNVVLTSYGEVIVYNTFKMNGIKLIFEDPELFFKYKKNGVVKVKRPDFYWRQKNLVIEVAGLIDLEAFGGDYTKKLNSAKKQMKKLGKEMIILDYYKYRKNLQGFYEYVCETFNFPYNPEDFWTANISKGVDVETMEKEVVNLLKKSDKTSGEKVKQAQIIKRYLSKPVDVTDLKAKPEGYKDVWDYRRQTGVGLRWSDIELRKKIQKAWCESSGSNVETTNKFKEIYSGEKLSKKIVEKIKSKFPDEFNMFNRSEICQSNLQTESISLVKKLTGLVIESQTIRLSEKTEDDSNGVDQAVIEVTKYLKFLSPKYKYQIVPFWKTKEPLIYINKGSSGWKTISTKHIRVVKVFKENEKEKMNEYLEDLREKEE